MTRKIEFNDQTAIGLTSLGLFLIGYRIIDAGADMAGAMVNQYKQGPLGLGIQSKIMSAMIPAYGGFLSGISKATKTDWDSFGTLKEPMQQVHAILSSNIMTGVGLGSSLAGIGMWIQLHPEIIENAQTAAMDQVRMMQKFQMDMLQNAGDSVDDIAKLAPMLAAL